MDKPLFKSDIESIIRGAADSFKLLEHKDIFITGGTGFFGKWLTQAFLQLSSFRSGESRLGILSREASRHVKLMPWLQHPSIRVYDGDVRNFRFPDEQYDIVIHAAVAASAALNESNPREMLETNIAGTGRALDFAKKCGAKTFLLTSSGAVYGRQPPSLENIAEDFIGAPSILNSHSAYGEGKRCAELLSVIEGMNSEMNVKIARCFGYVAPYLPLTTHFAVGNFINNSIHRKSIEIRGDGSPFRSYMYGVDLVIWLLRILTHGENCVPYNVGSDRPISIRELAYLVNEVALAEIPNLSKEESGVILRSSLRDGPAERYVPSVDKAKKELGLKLSVSERDAIRKTLRWHLSK